MCIRDRINRKLVVTLDKIEKRVQTSNENTVAELQLITNTLINELNKNSQASMENNNILITLIPPQYTFPIKDVPATVATPKLSSKIF